MSLYTKYRPRDWDSVIGQEYITTILKNSLTSGRISHAYLFHGSRGTGKTSCARILAKGVNCLDLKDGNPCHECVHCRAFDDGTMLDIIEIDAASNTGVENIRDLIEKARFEPNQGKYKIYIIDEVHMLSTGAFNALLKTLEEPPEHVKFILATTETEKVPETIRSRTLRFDFRKIGIWDIIARLEYVCEVEHIQAEKEALQIIAKAARGGLRDALTLLEQNVIDKEVRTEHVRYTLALIEEDLIDTIIADLIGHDVDSIFTIIEKLRERHVQSRSFFEQLMYRLRDLMVENLSNGLFYQYGSVFRQIEDAYTRVRSIPDGMMLVEITLLRIAKGTEQRDEKGETPQALPPQKESTAPKIQELPKAQTESIQKPTVVPVIEQQPIKASEPSPRLPSQELPSQSTPKLSDHPTPFSFPLLLTEIKSATIGLATDLKTARFKIEGDKLILTFSKKWNYDRVNLPKTKATIADTLTGLFGGTWSVICHLEEGVKNLSHAVDDIF